MSESKEVLDSAVPKGWRLAPRYPSYNQLMAGRARFEELALIALREQVPWEKAIESLWVTMWDAAPALTDPEPKEDAR